MRNRILQKTFWTSEEILELKLHERLLFLGMTNYADDEGIIKTHPKSLKAKIFPADNITIASIESGLLRMKELGLIKFNEDRTLCRFVSWTDYQKIYRHNPSKFKFVEESGDDSMNTHGTFNEHSSPNNNNNNKNNNKSKTKIITEFDDIKNLVEFEDWYDKYPRKVARPRAEGTWFKIIDKHNLDDIIKGTRLWCDYWKATNTEKKYIPHPATFLNQERFMDLPELEASDIEWRLDTTGHYIGVCSKCQSNGFYRKEELSHDSKCCKAKLVPNRDLLPIEDNNAQA